MLRNYVGIRQVPIGSVTPQLSRAYSPVREKMKTGQDAIWRPAFDFTELDELAQLGLLGYSN